MLQLDGVALPIVWTLKRLPCFYILKAECNNFEWEHTVYTCVRKHNKEAITQKSLVIQFLVCSMTIYGLSIFYSFSSTAHYIDFLGCVYVFIKHLGFIHEKSSKSYNV